MRALIQRVSEATVDVGGETVGSVGPGLCVFVGVTHDDGVGTAQKLASKVWNLRIFAAADSADGSGMDRSVAETGGEILVVSQFTLYGDTRKGRRPSWIAAASPEEAEPLCEAFIGELRKLGAKVSSGVFGADMAVSLVNDGPVTLMLEVSTAPQ